MMDDRLEELASLHALELLEGAERTEFLAELDRNPELRKRVVELREAAASLALACPQAEPPAALKARVLDSISARTARQPGTVEAQKDAPKVEKVVPFPSWTMWLAAACIGIAVWYGRLYSTARGEVVSLKEQQRVSQLALQQAQSRLDETTQKLVESGQEIADLGAKLKSEGDLAHFKISTLASMLGNSPAALAVAVWDPAREEGVLSVSKLPAAAAEKDYQLWVIDTQYPSPVSGGIFTVDPVTGEAHVVFKTDKPIKTIAKFAVSLERKGGVPERQGPIVLLSE